jgi:hypothetical protein
MNGQFELSNAGFRPQRAIRQMPSLNVSLTLPFESWQLLWKLRTVDIHEAGVICRYDITDEKDSGHALELWTLLEAQPDVHLQIDTQSDDFFSPSVDATLINRSRQPGALELEFSFTSRNQDIESLLASMTDRSPNLSGKSSHN